MNAKTAALAAVGFLLWSPAARAGEGGPSGLHLGLSVGRAVALAGSGTSSTDWHWAAALEADYQFERFYLGAVALEAYGGHDDGFLETELDTVILALRGGALWRAGPFDLFAGGGGGYVRQQFATNLGIEDGGTPTQVGPVDTIKAVGALLEAGAILWRGERHLQLSVVCRVVLPLSRHSDPAVNQRFPIGLVAVRVAF